jgi:Ca2+-binding EF-hand superfamily protein
MGAVGSHHSAHKHHQKISTKLGTVYSNEGVIELNDEEIRHLWDHYDANHNGILEHHELEQMVKDMIEHTITDPKEREAVWNTLNKDEPFIPHVLKQMENDKGEVNLEDFEKNYHKIFHSYMDKH